MRSIITHCMIEQQQQNKLFVRYDKMTIPSRWKKKNMKSIATILGLKILKPYFKMNNCLI